MWDIGIWDVSSIPDLGDWQDGAIEGDRTIEKGCIGVGVGGEEAGFGTCWGWIDLGLLKQALL